MAGLKRPRCLSFLRLALRSRATRFFPAQTGVTNWILRPRAHGSHRSMMALALKAPLNQPPLHKSLLPPAALARLRHPGASGAAQSAVPRSWFQHRKLADTARPSRRESVLLARPLQRAKPDQLDRG